jgi:hypothetical protein
MTGQLLKKKQKTKDLWSKVPDWALHQDLLTDCLSVVLWLWLWLLGFEDLMLDCWLEVSCIPKVLRPANSIKVFRGFPWSQSKCWVATQIPRCTACFPCSPPNGNIGNFALHYRDFEIRGPGPPGWWSLRWDSKIRPWVLRDFDLRVTALARLRSNCTVIYRPVLSSERALQTYKPVNV